MSAGHSDEGMLAAGSRAPSFELHSLQFDKRNGKGVAQPLEDAWKNGPALLVFYKISCPVCQLTLPYLERLSAGSRLHVVGISQDDSGPTHSLLDRLHVAFTTLLDLEENGYPASNAYGITSVPALFLIDPGGRIANSFSGFSKRDLEALAQLAGVPVFHPGEKVPEWKAG